MTEPAARRVANDSLPALPSRALAFFTAAIPVILACAFWPTLQSAFFLPKNAALVCATALLTLGVLLTGIALPHATTAIERWFLYSITAFLFAALLSAAASSRKEMAVQPLLVLAAGCVFMPMTAAALRGRAEWLFRGIALSGFAVAAVAIANRFGFDVFTPFGLHPSYSGGRMQIASTLGNPNFVASYLAASAPALLYLALRRETSAWFWRAALAASFAAIWWTQSRIGLLCFFVAILLPVLRRSSPRKATVVLLLALLFAASAIYINRANPRALSTASAGRAFLWRVSLADGVHLLGDGPGTFYYFYPERMGRWFAAHPSPTQLRFADMQTHAHNDFVEFLVSTGALGAATLLTMLALGICCLGKRLTSSEAAPFALSGVIALLLSACFDFPLQRAESWALLWFWFAFAFLDAERQVYQLRKHAIVLVPISLLAAGLATLSVAPAVASYHVHEGIAWEAQSGDAEAVKEYQKAICWDRTSADAQFYLTRALANSGREQSAANQAQLAGYWLDEPDLWELRARILLKLGEKQAALRELDDGLHRFPYSKGLASARAEIAVAPEK